MEVGVESGLGMLNTLGDRVVVNWKSGSREDADAFLAELVRRIAASRSGEQVFWRVVAECGFVNLASPDRPEAVDGAEILGAAWEKISLEKICEFRGESSVRTWLYAIGKNAARDLERRERRHTSRADDNGDVDSPRPTGMLEGSSLLTFCHDLQAARQTLSADEAELLDRWLEHGDRSGAAIARELGLQERTVRNRLDRLFEKLSVCLDDPRRNKRRRDE